MESWDANSDTEFAFFFEDDIEVAKRFFEYTIIALEKYVVPGGSAPKKTVISDRFFGISLCTPRFNEIALKPVDWTPEQEIGIFETQFLFQLPCSWGALLIPWLWRQFLRFYMWRRDKDGEDLQTSVPDSATRAWRRSWKKFLIEFMYMRGLYMLYPSLPRQVSFSTHHREPGEHTRGDPEEHLVDELGTIKLDYFTVPLAQGKHTQHVDRLFAEMKSLRELPILSFHHERVPDVHALTQLGLYTVEVMESRGWDHGEYQINPTCVLDTITFPVNPGYEGERFLVYEPQLSMGHQLNALQNAAAYAKILNRTLLVPPIITPANFSIQIAMERIADFDKKYVKMILLEDFIEQHDGWIDRITQFVPWHIRGRDTMKMSDDVLLQAGMIPANQAIVHVLPTKEKEIRKQFGGCHDKILAFRHLFGSFASFNDLQSLLEYREWTSKLRVSRPIRELIETVTEKFGSPLACMEYSHGDDPLTCGADLKSMQNLTAAEESTIHWSCQASIEETIQYAVKESLPMDPKMLYIISSAPRPGGSWPLTLASRSDILMTPAEELNDLPIEIRMQIAEIVEGEICSKAAYFLGNTYSSVSNRIIKKRGDRPSSIIGSSKA